MNDNIKKVVVDAGHGGVDLGAVNGNIYEKNFNLEVAKMCIRDRTSRNQFLDNNIYHCTASEC